MAKLVFVPGNVCLTPADLFNSILFPLFSHPQKQAPLCRRLDMEQRVNLMNQGLVIYA